MLRKVYLYGHLAAKYGPGPFRYDVGSAAEAVRAMLAMKPGFKNTLREGEYQIYTRNSRYERDRMGSVVISAGLRTEEIST